MKPARPRSRTGLIGWLVVAALSGPLAVPGRAATAIQRCIGEQGEPMFTERCANPVASVAIAEETPRRRPAATPMTVAASPSSARAADFCARTPESLARQVDAALRTRNGVRFSGYALWLGMSARSARGEARDLLALMRSASLSVALRPASSFDGERSDASLPMLAMMRMTSRGGIADSEELWFRIVRARGCYWLDPQPERRREEVLPTATDASTYGVGYALQPN